MYPQESMPMDYSVDELSTDILGYLVKFSTEVMGIEDSIMDLVADGEIGADPNFCKFVSHFREGRYYYLYGIAWFW